MTTREPTAPTAPTAPRRLRRASAVALVLAAAAAAWTLLPSPVRAADEDDAIDGWVVTQHGEEETYLRDDGWELDRVEDYVQLSRQGERISYFGTFVAEQLEETKRSDPIPSTERLSGWIVDHAGTSRFHPRHEGWTVTLNPNGALARRRGQTVWYYGTFRVYED